MDSNPRNPGILACLIILTVEVFAAILAHAIIACAVLREFHRKKHLPLSDKIRVSLQISGFCFTIASYANILADVLWPDLFTTLYTEGIIITVTIYSLSSCTWLTALICFFYFTKIVDVRSDFLAWAKKMLNSSAHYLIVVIHVLCLGISFLSMLLFTAPEAPSTNSSVIPPASSTFGRRAAHLLVAKFTLAMIIVPLLTMIISVLLTVRFLKLHGQTMEKNMGSSGDDTLKIYQNIANRMTRFLFVYAALFLFFFVFYFSSFSQQSPGYWMTMILMFSFTPIQLIAFIINYPPLKNTWKDLPQYIICCKQFRAHNH